jgi:hypothetical protein
MARAKKIQEHEVLRDSLSSWATKHGFLNDPYVSGLVLALDKRRNLSMWATLSPLEYLPRPEAKGKRARVLRFVTLIRNTLIFAPVALTWAAVGQATSAFGTYVNQNAGSVVNFLEFWENGYGVLDSKWTIGHIAFLDFILILAVILLIVYLHFANDKERELRIKSEIGFDNERLALGISLHEYLFSKRTTDNVKMNQNLATVTQDLLQTSSSLNKVAKVVEKASKETPTNKQVLSSLKELTKAKAPTRWNFLDE